MDIANIMVFAGIHLEETEKKYNKGYITEKTLQDFLIHRDEVAKPISFDELNEALGRLIEAGFLVMYKGDQYGAKYKRYNPNLRLITRKQLEGKNEHVRISV